jgi:hypothetical protein
MTVIPSVLLHALNLGFCLPLQICRIFDNLSILVT